MKILDYFRSRSKSTANVAKERLQIIISHERSQSQNPDYLIAMQEEILDVIAKYVSIDRNQVKIQIGQVGKNSILELNVTMPHPAEEIKDRELEKVQ